MAFYFQLFWLPTALSAGLLALLWVNDCLHGRMPGVFAGWFLTAIALQLFALTTGMWALGLLLQTALSITLLVKQQLERL